jgi:hypothetical protein
MKIMFLNPWLNYLWESAEIFDSDGKGKYNKPYILWMIAAIKTCLI